MVQLSLVVHSVFLLNNCWPCPAPWMPAWCSWCLFYVWVSSRSGLHSPPGLPTPAISNTNYSFIEWSRGGEADDPPHHDVRSYLRAHCILPQAPGLLVNPGLAQDCRLVHLWATITSLSILIYPAHSATFLAQFSLSCRLLSPFVKLLLLQVTTQ